MYLYSRFFEKDFDPRIISTGFSFWLSSLQYDVPKNLIGAGPYNENIFFLEWLAALYLEQDPHLKQVKHDLSQLTKHLQSELKTRESTYSAMSRLHAESAAYQDYLEYEMDGVESICFHTKQASYWNHIMHRAKNRQRLEESSEAQSITKTMPKRAELSVAVALFTFYRLASKAINPYSDALLSLAELEKISSFDLRLSELRRIYKSFL